MPPAFICDLGALDLSKVALDRAGIGEILPHRDNLALIDALVHVDMAQTLPDLRRPLLHLLAADAARCDSTLCMRLLGRWKIAYDEYPAIVFEVKRKTMRWLVQSGKADELGEEACKAHGISARTLDRARLDVGVDAFKVAKVWMWRLAEKEGRQ